MSKVLLVDDEPDIHEILDVHLKRKGIDVEHALTGEEGVEAYKKMLESNDLPDLVIMDLNLSGEKGIDGIELHKEGKGKRIDGARAAEQILKINPDAIIWGYTAWTDTEWAEKLRKAGAKKIVKRLVPFKEFAEMVADFLQSANI
ncbi:MAG: hypothetical protein DRN31_04325 [Thermoplasmata archaeon]|nr:MAG: hypothetical protein DRN31_04325 [Thermoplasmata archaeon]